MLMWRRKNKNSARILIHPMRFFCCCFVVPLAFAFRVRVQALLSPRLSLSRSLWIFFIYFIFFAFLCKLKEEDGQKQSARHQTLPTHRIYLAPTSPHTYTKSLTLGSDNDVCLRSNLHVICALWLILIFFFWFEQHMGNLCNITRTTIYWEIPRVTYSRGKKHIENEDWESREKINKEEL